MVESKYRLRFWCKAKIVLLLVVLWNIDKPNLLAQISSEQAQPFPVDRLGGKFIDRLFPIPEGQLCCSCRAGSGPTLILIPGTFSDSRVYSMVVPHLNPDFNLLIFENRGLGKSWPPHKNGSIELCARDVLKVASQMHIEKFYVGGHSLGGMISL